MFQFYNNKACSSQHTAPHASLLFLYFFDFVLFPKIFCIFIFSLDMEVLIIICV